MKRNTARFRAPTLAVAASGALVLSACANGADAEGGGSGDAGPSDAHNLVYAHAISGNDPYHECGVAQMPELLEEQDVGLTMEVYSDGQVHGSTAQQLDALVSGELDLTLGAPNQVAAWDPRLAVLDAMYLFDDRDHLRNVIEGEIGTELTEGLVEHAGLRVLGWGLYGDRHLTANVPVESPDDLASVRLRSVEGELSTYNAGVLGGEAVPVAFPELYVSLQQGVVDAQENPVTSVYANSFYEVQDYLILTGHNIQYFPTVISESTWQDLSEEQQNALASVVETALADVEACQDETVAEILEEFEETGTIEILEDIDFDAFRERAESMYPGPFEDDWGDLYERIRDEA